MKLVACPSCRAQYDVAGLATDTVACRCGATFPATPPAARDAAVRRCAGCGALVGDGERICTFCRAEVARAPDASGPVCPECLARNPAGARHCTGCGLAFVPQPVRSRAEPLECPACAGVPLAARNLGGLWVDECPMCLGLWAPGDVMDRLIEQARERRHEAALVSTRRPKAVWKPVVYRRCPDCGGAMQRRNFGRRSGVIIDWCGSHGTWLDADEMEAIAAFILEGGLQHSHTEAEGEGPVLPADPGRAAAWLAAEQLLAEERARSQAKRSRKEPSAGRVWKSLGDLFAELLK